MLDENETDGSTTASPTTTTTSTTTRRRAAGRPAGPPAPVSSDIFAAPEAPKKKAAARKKAAPKPDAETPTAADDAPSTASDESATDAPPAKKAPRKRPAKKTAAQQPADEATDAQPAEAADDETPADEAKGATTSSGGRRRKAPTVVATFQAPETTVQPAPTDDSDDDAPSGQDAGTGPEGDRGGEGEGEGGAPKRRRRSRGGRRRRKADDGDSDQDASGSEDSDQDADTDGESGDDSGDGSSGGSSGTRRRRRRARAGENAGSSDDDPDNTVVKVRSGRSAEDEITGVSGSTRLEAKKQRRREGREAGRRRAPIVSESEFLARRESVERTMVVRQHQGTGQGDDYTQIAVLEDKVLVEHYVARESQTSIIGNVYLGKVQNVLPSMEAAFVDIGAGRNAVIYAGEVDWSGVENGKARKIEEALSPGQTILVQVTKDPIGQKGARLTSQISLPGRFLVYVPNGGSSGISRKLPDTERARLKALLKEVLPEDAGVIVRTAAEGATEDQLKRDVGALQARWEDIARKVESGHGPTLLYAEPDLVIKVVRDLFNEDFAELVVEGDDAWDNIEAYVSHVAPDLRERARRWTPADEENPASDVFAELRIDEQIHKALDRKVWLPSGGSLIIDRTEAMTVVDVNTGKFTGSGGNLEETVTKNNLEAAEEIVRQLRLRDIGGIIVIDFIDMVLESNRELVLRRLVECLGRDRTRHQVAEVTSLGLVQMTRKRIGTGLLESFSTECEHCKGRGVVITAEPVEPRKDDGPRRGRRGGRGGNGGNGNNGGGNSNNNGGGSNGGGKGRGRGGNQQAKGDQQAKDAEPKDNGPQDSGPKDSDTAAAEAKDASAQDAPATDGSSTDESSTGRSQGSGRSRGRGGRSTKPSDESTGSDDASTPERVTADAVEAPPTQDATRQAPTAPQEAPAAEPAPAAAAESSVPETDPAGAAATGEGAPQPEARDVPQVEDGPVLTDEGQAP
ncbi:MAG: Rne/Rng family ribonuclease [Aeromicrobium erythreum]